MTESKPSSKPTTFDRLRCLFAGCFTCWGRKIQAPEPRIQPSSTPTDFIRRLPPEIRNKIYGLCDTFPEYPVTLIPHKNRKTSGFRRPKYPAITQVCRQLRIETLSFYEHAHQHMWKFGIDSDSWYSFQTWKSALSNRPLYMEHINFSLGGPPFSPDPSKAQQESSWIQITICLAPNSSAAGVAGASNNNALKADPTSELGRATAVFKEVFDLWVEKLARGEFWAEDLNIALTKALKAIHSDRPSTAFW